MFSSIFKSKLTYVMFFLYFLLVFWWLKIFISGTREADENYLFGFAYSFIALIGGINGLFIAKKWGAYKSLVGKGIIFFSLGLLGEWFGQTIWTYYNVIARVEVPYPSIADIGYFSIIPLYALGMFSFAKTAGAKFTLKSIKGKLIAIVMPIVMVSISYFLFLKDFSPDLSQPVRTFLDFGYPLGEALTISIALATYGLSKGILGGIMKNNVLFLIFALFYQYITDYTFLYTAAKNTYYNAGPVDMLYTTSFVIMSLGLIAFKRYD